MILGGRHRFRIVTKSALRVNSKRGFAAALLLSNGLLAGCATTSVMSQPPAHALPVPDAWSANGGVPVTDISQYWVSLGDPLLSEFVSAAATNNLDLAQSVARLKEARAALNSARANYLPQVSGSGGVRRDVGDFAASNLQYSIGADASWEVALFGRISSSVAVSRADLAAAGYSLADVQRLVIGNVATATISARSTALQLAIARDTLTNQDENLQIARWRNQAGLVSSLDVEQARVQRAQTAASIPALEADLAATSNAISALIGEPPGRVLGLLSTPTAVPVPPKAIGLDIPANVLRRRPDVRAAEASLIADGARIDVAQAQLLPLVRLTGSINSGATGIGNLFDIITGNLFAGISQLIFDGGRSRAQISSAQAGAEGSLAAWRQSILRALEEVETGTSDLKSARERVALFAEAQEAASNAAILARSQYQAGLTDFRTLLTTENQLLSSRNSLVTAEAQRASAFVRLTQALGGGWTAGDDGSSPTTTIMPETGNSQ